MERGREMIKSAEEFVTLRNSSVPEEYGRSAHEEADESVWLDVINKFPEMKCWVAHNKTIPISILRILADDPSSDVRYSVALKRKLDKATFNKLSRDADESVRQRLTFNKKIPRDLLVELSKDSSEFVREAALENLQKHTKR